MIFMKGPLVRLKCPVCSHRFWLGTEVCGACGHIENVRYSCGLSKKYVRSRVKRLFVYAIVICVSSLLAYVGFRVPGYMYLMFSLILLAPISTIIIEILFKIIPGSTKITLTNKFMIETRAFFPMKIVKLSDSILTCSDPPDAEDALHYLTNGKMNICLDYTEFDGMDTLVKTLREEVQYVAPEEIDQYERTHW